MDARVRSRVWEFTSESPIPFPVPEHASNEEVSNVDQALLALGNHLFPNKPSSITMFELFVGKDAMAAALFNNSHGTITILVRGFCQSSPKPYSTFNVRSVDSRCGMEELNSTGL